MNRTTTWIPAHPAYGSISMFRYWKLLAAESKPDDPWTCNAILPMPEDSDFDRAGKFSRAWQRKIAYPLRVRLRTKAPIAHILDHSWAEMIDFVPRNVASVITVHDLIPLRDSRGLSPVEVARFRDRVSRLKNADAVIAVSEYTRDETIRLLDVDPQRVHVVPNGVDAPPHPAPPRPAGSTLRIGSVGSTLPRKNLAIFPAALRAYRASAPRLPHFIRAGTPLDSRLRAEIHAVIDNDAFEELGRVNDARLEHFYASLDVLVVPSHFEGFGLPVLEAMARGVPVIAARSSSLPEVGGDAALYFDPDDPEELAQRLREIADPTTAANLRQAGLTRASGYSWRRTLEGFFRIYDSLI
jgi:alpha-1,3-rhamnosyl/mannosyltransferase